MTKEDKENGVKAKIFLVQRQVGSLNLHARSGRAIILEND